MGIRVNSQSIYEEFKMMYNDRYYVDKSLVIKEFNQLINTENRFVCITRPRRFGKTKLANMLTAYYGKEYDSKKYFDTLKIAQKDENNKYINNTYEKYINKYNVIFMNFSIEMKKYKTVYGYIEKLTKQIVRDLKKIYQDVEFEEEMEDDLKETLEIIYEEKNEKFIFILDEWDYIFSNKCCSEKEEEEYLEFLTSLLKNQAYVAFAYMTGVLPIAKNSSGSALNMFDESTMFENDEYSEYFGFSEDEVEELCKRNRLVKYEELKEWYNGYLTIDEKKVFNPRSVIKALNKNRLKSYWTETGPMNEITNFLKRNIADVREDVVRMVNGEKVTISLERHSAEKKELITKEDIYSAMIIYGFLTYHNRQLSIPNRELMKKFESALKDRSMGNLSSLVRKSDDMLQATLRKDTSTMMAILEYAHTNEIPFFVYNDENSLSCVITLVYLSARDIYKISRETKEGKGYVDFIFRPYDKTEPIIIIELKKGRAAKEAISQIYKRKYYMNVLEEDYTGEILLVGINYDEEKGHDCIVETLDKNRM